jgi:predicted nucleic acid-binding protein
MSVFIDTSAIYALLVRTEERHDEVVASYRAMIEAGRVICTTNYVLLETVALLQHRIGLDAVRDLARILQTLRISWVTEELHRLGMDRLLKADRRRVSLVDCVSLCFMEWEGIREAMALDQHFGEQGRRVHPE